MRGVKNRTENSLLLLNYDVFDVKILITLVDLREEYKNKKTKAVHDPFKKLYKYIESLKV